MTKKGKYKGLRHQHYIPRLLLKGFSSKVKKKGKNDEFFAYQFRRSAEAHEPNIKNIAQERDFYGNPNESDIEREFSLREGDYAKLLQILRSGLCTPDLKGRIDEFIAHLIIRNKTARDGVVTLVKSGVGKMFDEIKSPKREKQLPSLVEKAVRQNPRLQIQLAQLPREARRILTNPANVLSQIKNSLDEITNQQLSEINHPTFAQNSHQKALHGDESLNQRLEFLRPINWSVKRFPSQTLVLGDVGPISKTSSTAEWGNSVLARSFHIICLPISSEMLLVGEKNDIDAPREINFEEVNLASVELSRELFVASTCTERELQYQNRLGTRGELVKEEEIKRMITNTIDNF